MKKDLVIAHSGGMDSSICLAIAKREIQQDKILSLSFDYGQRHVNELEQAAKICKAWNIDHQVIDIKFLKTLTKNALTDHTMDIIHAKNQPANTMVPGRNGLFARIAGIYANTLGANVIMLGTIGIEEDCSGYRDCNRKYFDLLEEILRIDFDNPELSIQTPLVNMTKVETLQVAQTLGVLTYLLNETVTCYNGIKNNGCGSCPACQLRNNALKKTRMREEKAPILS